MTQGPPASFWYDALVQSCRDNLALPPEQWTFKADKRFTDYLEHLFVEQGHEIIAGINDQFPDIRDEVFVRLQHLSLTNDKYGQPPHVYFDDLGFGLAPTNLLWTWHSLLFFRQLHDSGCTSTDVLEIGAGYGGLALYMRGLCDLFGVTINHYTTLDLLEVSRLQAAYATAVGIDMEAIHGSDGAAIDRIMSYPGKKSVFSCYAYAEFDERTQEWYADKILQHTDHGLLIWNTYAGWGHRGPNPVFEFMSKPVTVEKAQIPTYVSQWDMQYVRW